MYLYRDPIDFYKGHRGLAALLELELGHNVFVGNL
jgi:transposase